MNEGAPPGPEWLGVIERGGSSLPGCYAEAGSLEKAYAAHLGVRPAQVLATSGGDEAIDRVFRAFLTPRKSVIFPTPTFVMVPRFARMALGRLRPVEYEWGRLPVTRIAQQVTDGTAVVVAISPDNPTGAAFSTEALTALAASLPPQVTFMVDLAYVEFADADPTHALLKFPNTVLVRTMSKAWGLAGLRVGFAVGGEKKIDALRAVGGPYALTGPSMAVAQDRLFRGSDAISGYVRYTRRARERLAALTREVGGDPHPSQANFVLARFPDTRWIRRGLAAQGILVRTFEDLPDHVRITVPRNDREYRRLARALRCLAKPDALLFDMDGVLADVRQSYREAIQMTCAAFGLALDPSDIDRAKVQRGANDDWTVTHRLLTNAGLDMDLGDVTDRFEAIYQGTDDDPGLRRHETMIPGRALLERLASRYKLAVVTGRPRADAQRFLTEHGITDLFDAVVCREDAPLKPDPAPIARAMQRLDVRCAWMLGDTPDDMRSAVSAGVVPVAVTASADGGARGASDTLSDALWTAGAACTIEANDNFGGLFDE